MRCALETRVKLEEAQTQVGKKRSGNIGTAIDDQVKSLVQLKLQIDGRISEKQAELTAAEYAANVASTIEDQIKGRSQVRALASQLAQLRAKSGSLESQISKIPINTVNLAPIAREAEEIAATYKVLLENYQMSRIEEKRQGEKFTVLQAPFVPDYPDKPKKRLIVMGFTAVGAGLGFLIVLFSFYLKSYRVRVDD